MDALALTIMQFLDSVIIVAVLAFVVWLVLSLTPKPRPVSGQTYLYIKPSDDDFFDMITEFRNDIPGK